ncbi:LVIVD repeat-containing protein [Promethearchaeum syntrophicum]|uniref:LVIVD repeat-containing protein n=1 Tax=Promethearchaeum syntrophicum TaxID=2594042 RepID=A0A5B9DDJ3_9ARCH|nr:hypothetical protein [Candidatus Prometheoarchaeum syntrophicum]QEE16786.1 LVIVD repeat protein [Candidatus Prometheoarchaeum syntrophicum]
MKNEGKKEKTFDFKKIFNIKKIVKKPLTYKILFILLILFSFLRQPIQISHLNRTEFPLYPFDERSSFDISGKYAYVSSQIGKIQILEIQNVAKPVLVGEMPINMSEILEVKIIDDHLFISGVEEFFYSSQTTILLIYDISDPKNPEILSKITNDFKRIDDFQIQDRILYIGCPNGLFSYNISNYQEPHYLNNTLRFSIISDMVVKGNYLYCISNYSDFYILDITNPENMVEVSSIKKIGVRDLEINNNYCYSAGFRNLYIINITDPINPILENTSNSRFENNVNIQLCENRENRLICKFSDGFEIFDIENPLHPSSISKWYSKSLIFDLKTINNRVYISTTNDILKIVDISLKGFGISRISDEPVDFIILIIGITAMLLTVNFYKKILFVKNQKLENLS